MTREHRPLLTCSHWGTGACSAQRSVMWSSLCGLYTNIQLTQFDNRLALCPLANLAMCIKCPFCKLDILEFILSRNVIHFGSRFPCPSRIHLIWVSMCDSINQMSTLVSDQPWWPGLSSSPIPSLSLVASVPAVLPLAGDYLPIISGDWQAWPHGITQLGPRAAINIHYPVISLHMVCVTLPGHMSHMLQSGLKNNAEHKCAISWPGALSLLLSMLRSNCRQVMHIFHLVIYDW